MVPENLQPLERDRRMMESVQMSRSPVQAKAMLPLVKRHEIHVPLRAGRGRTGTGASIATVPTGEARERGDDRRRRRTHDGARPRGGGRHAVPVVRLVRNWSRDHYVAR